MGGQPDTITQTNKVELGPEQKKIFDLAFPKIQDYASKEIELFPGSGIVGFNPEELQAQQDALAMIPGFGESSKKALASNQLLMDPGFMLNPNQYMKAAAGAVNRQGMEGLQEALRGIRGGAETAGGQFSGGSTRRGVAEAMATGKATQGISDSIAKMYLDNYQRGLSTMLDATKNNASMMSQALFPSQIRSAIGGQNRLMDQAKLNEAIQRFYTEQEKGFLQSKELMAMVHGMPGATGHTTVKGAGTDPMQQMLGMGMTLLGNMIMPGMGSAMGPMAMGKA